ncbi:MAG: flavin reductase family protein [Bacteroidetes bacterium]|nr:flavin reductase family protein [Bacteroidota bacterium]
MKTIDPLALPPNLLHRMLLTAIAPRPIAFASTIDAQGLPNLSPFSCFNVFGINPTTLIFSPSRGGRDNRLKDTYLNIKEIPEVVINTVSYSMVEQANLASTEYPKGINEFVKAGFTPIASDKIRPFRVGESPVQLECKVRQVIETSDRPGSANLVVCEVVLIHVNEKLMDIKGQLDPRKLDLVGRMGVDYYVRASGKALFTVEKPAEKQGIGIDSLPEEVRMSNVLTGNDLGKLGSVIMLPSAPEVNEAKKTATYKKLISENPVDRDKLIDSSHRIARDMISRNEVHEALKLLLAIARYQ